MIPRIFLLILLITLSLDSSHAATLIEVVAKVADVPAGSKIPDSPAQLAKNKSINLLSATPVSVASGTRAKIEINQPVTTASGGTVLLGLTLEVTPLLAESGNITFNGSVIDRARSMSAQQESDRLSTTEFATREVYFQGWVKAGETTLIETSPIESAVKGSKASPRELVVYLTFSKKVVSVEKATSDTDKNPDKKSAKTTKSTAKKTTAKNTTKKTKR